ncbi:hypothetical protein F2Q69_00011064 [Brassica cretica]|uniref:Dof-type domain-containing protein n=1 Tax=Brassica cretica TaxID=69181 RepID=A0A8S9QU66_BRACR|nr:hypothetical protein F2Q69_00011064 [Brassica cretica]
MGLWLSLIVLQRLGQGEFEREQTSKFNEMISDILHIFSYLPRYLNFIEHTSNIGWKESQRARPIIIDPGFYHSKKSGVFWAKERRSLPASFKLFMGSTSVALTRPFLEFCIWGWDNLPRTLLMYYTNFLLSSEGYFQTVVCNNKDYQNTTVNHDLHYTHWDTVLQQRALNLTVEDFHDMVQSGAPFAREFREDDLVLDKIDAELLGQTDGGLGLKTREVVKPTVAWKRLEKLMAPPSNYNQGGAGASATGGHGLPPQLQPQSQPLSNGSGGSGSIRPGSMVDRARQANVAMPEAALKCPRCESTNTKFCYFNNYSLTQPRHFCKTCRRYWTRGGALRNVPVGGGCRRNRRTKSSSNNNSSTATSNNTSFSSAASGNASTISAILSSNYGGTHENILSQILSPGRLMNPSYNHHLGDLTDNTKTDNNMSLLNYGGLSQDLRSIHMGNPGGSLMSCVDEWRTASHHQQPQILGGGNLEDSNPNPSSNGFYPCESPRITSASISSALASQFSSVKVEDNNPYKWVNVNGNCSSWTDLSTFGSSR